MQITKVKVTPVEMNLRQPIRMARSAPIEQVTAIFVRFETRQGITAWGCTVAHPELTGEQPQKVLDACYRCADRIPDLHPTNIEYSLAELAPILEGYPSALNAFDLAFHDLLAWAAGMPLYRLLGGYRSKIQTSITIPLTPVEETVEIAKDRVRMGFRMLKIKGGLNPDEDVHRVRAVRRALPEIILRLDLDGGYSVQQALDVSHALQDTLEMIEQPTPPDNLEALSQVTRLSPIPILADQSMCGPDSALNLAANHAVDGISVKLATCGGLRCARQIDSIARAAQLSTMVSCLIEPALLIAAGLALALSSPNVRYGDLDGHFDLLNDPSRPGFRLEEGWLIAPDTPGLGCSASLG